VTAPAPPIVTLLTDFGAGSGYPAQMKGVLLSAVPEVRLVDVSHEVPPFDVLAGALLLEACAPRFPPDAVHLAVVDPGVGTARRALCVVDPAGRRFVGPDNGLFTPFLGQGSRARLLANRDVVPEPASATFHGRDLFAPVAAWLARGGDAARLGPAIGDPVRLRWPGARHAAGRVEGECLVADRFGNVLTSVREDDVRLLSGPVEARVGGHRARLVRTFGEVERGELLAFVGSSGRLEIAVRDGSAGQLLGDFRGAPVSLGPP
jgi:S-adenosylmethionine hydrolase